MSFMKVICFPLSYIQSRPRYCIYLHIAFHFNQSHYLFSFLFFTSYYIDVFEKSMAWDTFKSVVQPVLTVATKDKISAKPPKNN